MRRCLLSITGTLFALASWGQAFEAIYGFPNVTTSSGTVAPAPVPTVTGLSCGTFTAFGVNLNPGATGRFSFGGWPVGAGDGQDNYGTYTAALSPFSYYEFSLTPLAGYTLNLSSLSFSVRRSGTGVRMYCVRTSLDAFASNLTANTGTSTNLGVIPDDVFFWKFDNTSTSSDQRGSEVIFGSEYTGITFPLFIRFYAWNSEASAGSFSIDDVKVKGQISDSALLSSVNEAVEELCVLTVLPDHILNNCDLRELVLYSIDGKFIKKWVEPPPIVHINDIEPGFYLALVKTSKGQRRQKMQLHR